MARESRWRLRQSRKIRAPGSRSNAERRCLVVVIRGVIVIASSMELAAAIEKSKKFVIPHELC
jgi:hypothetical protein